MQRIHNEVDESESEDETPKNEREEDDDDEEDEEDDENDENDVDDEELKDLEKQNFAPTKTFGLRGAPTSFTVFVQKRPLRCYCRIS